MTAWDLICWVMICLLGGILPARTARRFLSAPKGRGRAAVPCLVIGSALGMPTWVGDGNPLYLFPVFLTAFLIGYGGSRSARLVVGVIFFEWMIAWSMIVDTRAVLPKEGHMSLSGRIWALIGLLSLAPLLSELAFSLWDVRFYTETAVDGIIDAAFYTLLPFQFISAIALLFAVVLLSRQQALEQAQQLAEMREVYYQGVQREQAQVRRLRHDLRNHLTALSGLLARGDTAGAADYVRALQQDEGVALD